VTESHVLIKRGVVVDTSPSVSASPDTDVLVSNGVIAAVGRDLVAPEGATVIDAANRIVLPGFVDTHRHTWQTPIRMVAPDTTLAEYMRGVIGCLASDTGRRTPGWPTSPADWNA
jgi:5-methylthioadenosine/S-adenosylhomocysteine deaminase